MSWAVVWNNTHGGVLVRARMDGSQVWRTREQRSEIPPAKFLNLRKRPWLSVAGMSCCYVSIPIVDVASRGRLVALACDKAG